VHLWLLKSAPLCWGYYIGIYCHQFGVLCDQRRPVVFDRIAEESEVLDGSGIDVNGGELIVVEVEYAEGSEMGKLERDIGEIVSGEVEFDE
jgi:hypothetical protein